MTVREKRNSDSAIKFENEQEIIPNSISKRNQLLIEILNETGCTLSELVGIKVEHIQTTSIIFPNRKVEISIGLSKRIKRFLRGRGSSSGFIFFSRQSTKLNVRRAQQIIKKFTGQTSSALRRCRIIELTKKKSIQEIKQISGLKRLKQKQFLSKEDILKVQHSVKTKEHLLMFNLLLETGCRISEFVNIRIEDVTDNSVMIGSSKKKISKKLVLEIREHVQEKNILGFLFSTRQSDRISDKRVFQILKSYGKMVDVELNPRILRNTKIAHMLHEGVDRSKIEFELGIKRLEFGSYWWLEKNE